MNPIKCPECNLTAGYNPRFKKMICPYCGWQSEELFKGNEEYLNDFVNQLQSYIVLDGSHFYDDNFKQELKKSLIKLLNSL